MNKIFANIRTLAALLIASAALAACSNEDSSIISEQPAQEQGPQVYTLTIQAGKADNAQTRALALDGTALKASWSNGDVLTVYNVTKDAALTGTLTASNASGSTATFSGTLTGTIEPNDQLTLNYHAATGLDAFKNQTGTLASASDYDMASATVTVKELNGGNITINEGKAEFTTTTAVLKITMTYNGSTPFEDVPTLTIKSATGGTNSDPFLVFTPAKDAYTTNGGNGVLYFTLPNKDIVKSALGGPSVNMDDLNIVFTATLPGNAGTFSATKTGYIFEGGNYYTTTLTMQAPLLTEADATDKGNVGKIVGANGRIYQDKDIVTKAGTTAIGMIACIGLTRDVTNTYNKGVVISLKDESDGQKTYSEAGSLCSGKIQVLSDCSSWMLPTEQNWKDMFMANNSTSETNYLGLKEAITKAGGEDLKMAYGYWTSTDGATTGTAKYWTSPIGTEIPGEVKFNEHNKTPSGPDSDRALVRAIFLF